MTAGVMAVTDGIVHQGYHYVSLMQKYTEQGSDERKEG